MGNSLDTGLHKRPPVVVLAEPYWYNGHFETQMQLFLSEILPMGFKVIVLCPDPRGVKAWVSKALPEYSARVHTGTYSLLDQEGRRALSRGRGWRHLSRAVARAQEQTGWPVDLVFITGADALVNHSFHSSCRRKAFKYPWVGLVFLPEYFRHRAHPLKRTAQWLNHKKINGMASCRGIAVLDEGVYPAMTRVFSKKKVVVFPDVTDERLPGGPLPDLAVIREEAGERTVIGLIGGLYRRKGLISFLKGMKALGSEKTYFLVAGHFPRDNYTQAQLEEIHEMTASFKAGDGRFIFEYIEDPVVFNAYVAACDVLFLAYEGFYHSSGLLTKAAVLEKLVIVSKGYLMGERVEAFKMGLTVTEGRVSEIVEAMRTLSDPLKRESLLRAARFKDYREKNNLQQLRGALKDLLGIEREG
ncbi:MAG: hypothetical protein AVO33_01030 [delta proteobacterium ML8_F1]|nr:MAG: hypothetical protein AVO33_01030 [delta proteobacterium ML8_F1]